MFSSLVAVITIVGFVLPGFVVGQLSAGRRTGRVQASDWELVLRSLFFSIVIHLAFVWWTRDLVDRLDNSPEAWKAQIGPILLYCGVVLVAVPVLVGVGLNRVLRSLEGRALDRGDLRAWSRALGARDPQHAWDFVFLGLGSVGAFILVRLKGGEAALAGKYAGHSYVSHTEPDKHGDLYLEEVWTLTAKGGLDKRLEPPRGAWLAADTIEAIQVLPFTATPAELVLLLADRDSKRRRGAARGLADGRASAEAELAAAEAEHARAVGRETEARTAHKRATEQKVEAGELEELIATLKSREQETKAAQLAVEEAQKVVTQFDRSIKPLAEVLCDRKRQVRRAAVDALVAYELGNRLEEVKKHAVQKCPRSIRRSWAIGRLERKVKRLSQGQ